jgi:hypothetical protein
MADERDEIDNLLRALRSDKDGLNEWNISMIRSLVVLSQEIKGLKEKLLEKADKREVWWIRFLLFSALTAFGSLALSLIPGILFKGHGS